jgi:hypothetical protein
MTGEQLLPVIGEHFPRVMSNTAIDRLGNRWLSRLTHAAEWELPAMAAQL